jgi:hypothetical protein
MQTEDLRDGTILGMAGGIMMAMWSMIALAVTGDGFWTPVNLIAHTVWRGAPLDGTFSVGALAVGLAAHMMLSAMLGVGIVVIARRATQTAGAVATVAFAVTAVAYAAQLVLWHAIDNAAASAFTPWVLAVGHIAFAMTVTAGAVVTTTRSPSSGRLHRAAHV